MMGARPTNASATPLFRDITVRDVADDVVLLLYVVSLSTDVALLGRYAVGDLSASPMLDHIMLRPNGSPAGTAGNGHSLLIYLSL